MNQEIKPFKIHIPDSELELLRKKLELARLPEGLADSEWGEEGEGGVTLGLMRETVRHWRDEYDWRAVEARLNEMPQFKTVIGIEGFDPVEVHFVHAKATSPAPSGGTIPLLFFHGWPGSFMEVQPMLPLLRAAGFDVVAPSLLGYGFSGYPRQAGFTAPRQVEVFHQLMLRLGYDTWVVQGGDWGSFLASHTTKCYPENVKALHLNVVWTAKNWTAQPGDLEGLTPIEKAALERAKWFRETNSAYQQIHRTKPRTIGYAMHDSPVGMLAWMADKLLLWSDAAAKQWQPDELITWTLLHYFPGPTTAMLMYRENADILRQTAQDSKSIGRTPFGVSHFAKELGCSPQRWVAEEYNVVFWREHEKGGHFAAYERPEELAADLIEFFHANWSK